MTNQVQNTKSTKSRKKVATVVGVGALVAALAGGGALSTLYTSIQDNRFSAAVADAEIPSEGALLRISGDPIDHVFDSETFNDQVRADWVLENLGELTTEFDGQFQTLAGIDADLAAALTVEYGLVDASGQVTSWRAGGTVAEPRTFGDVTGITSIDAGQQIPVAVRVLLADPSLISSDDADLIGEMLHVTADFTVSYMDPLER